MVRSCFFFGASTLAFAALAASYYGDSDYNPRIISILPQSDQALSLSLYVLLDTMYQCSTSIINHCIKTRFIIRLPDKNRGPRR